VNDVFAQSKVIRLQLSSPVTCETLAALAGQKYGQRSHSDPLTQSSVGQHRPELKSAIVQGQSSSTAPLVDLLTSIRISPERPQEGYVRALPLLSRAGAAIHALPHQINQSAKN